MVPWTDGHAIGPLDRIRLGNLVQRRRCGRLTPVFRSAATGLRMGPSRGHLPRLRAAALLGFLTALLLIHSPPARASDTRAAASQNRAAASQNRAAASQTRAAASQNRAAASQTPAAASRTTAPPSCASYPTPGTIAPADSALPGWLTQRYAILTRARRAGDRISATDVSSSLTAAGLELNHSLLLGTAAFGGRVYLVPAQHLLAFRLAPDRCLPASERSLENELRPQLERQYKHAALCIIVLHSTSASPTCGAADANPEALLYAAGTPGFGLVPNGISEVTVSYLNAPKRTVKVRNNFFLLDEPHQPAAPCALEWETQTGNVTNTFAGCDYAQLLQPPLDADRRYVQSTLATLQTQVSTLIADIDSGNLAQAESDWLTAHETWLDVGQDDEAYSAYGQLGEELDGTAAGDPEGTADPHFTGFHKVEMDLWQDDDLTAAASDAVTLQGILDQIVATPLNAALPSNNNGIAAWVLRPHEIMEDAIRDTLSGDDEYGSATAVASIIADVTATREFLTVLAPVLGPLAPGLLPEAKADLTALDNACAATQVNGHWVSIADLPVRQREQIDADAGTAAQLLDRVPDVLTNVGNGAPTA
jgi:iron uptake system EfeUOB component EfeO/EfeM